jgi:hypothetical protein
MIPDQWSEQSRRTPELGRVELYFGNVLRYVWYLCDVIDRVIDSANSALADIRECPEAFRLLGLPEPGSCPFSTILKSMEVSR